MLVQLAHLMQFNFYERKDERYENCLDGLGKSHFTGI
jgi:hypothetical protein